MTTSKWSHESVTSTPVVLPEEEQRKIVEARTPEQNEQLVRHQAHKLFAAHSRSYPHQDDRPSGLPSDWREEAVCRGVDPDDFFPDKGVVPKAAKSLCHVCPVRIPCLEYALETNKPFGVWGGHGIRERRRMRAAWLRQKNRQKSG